MKTRSVDDWKHGILVESSSAFWPDDKADPVPGVGAGRPYCFKHAQAVAPHAAAALRAVHRPTNNRRSDDA